MRDLLNQTSFQFLLALVVLGCLFVFLGFGDVFFAGPGGIHFLRQTDSLSFASQYFNRGFEFFEPRLLNLVNNDGKAACEFPITYFLAALIYKSVGNEPFVLKLLHFFIVSIGVFGVFKLAHRILQDYVYAALIALFLFTSTVFNFYSFNYLPDAPALGFCLLGWYLFYEFISTDKSRYGALGAVFFALGGLIKVTYLINPLTAIVVLIGSRYFQYEKPIDTRKRIRVSIWFVAGLIIPVVWVFYLIHYNNINQSTSFNTRAIPIWILNKGQVKEVLDHMWNFWYNKYFAHSSFHFLLVISFIPFVFYKKASSLLLLNVVILFFGSLAYFILFFPQFKDHDYYFLAFFPLFVFLIINGIKSFQNYTEKKAVHVGLKLILLIIVVVGTNYSHGKLQQRFEATLDRFSKAGLTIERNLVQIDSLGIPKDAKLVVAPDNTPNGGLYFLNRMGWSIYSNEDLLEKVSQYKARGAEYLVLLSDSYREDLINQLKLKLVWSNEDLSVYEI